ncbi:hypothetical protein [Bradyrhizobium sp. Ai1a-2]|uniref:hypothetical protein n=1 Tax=Bradyrhizobium sp. Ai1a-2 TaxID=196490 RepID=UPI0004069E81|nr:hypothetical protein [Bradyrhizobium sp. Ai1a-2]
MQHQVINRLLGVGTLTWCGSERRSDRYGTVYLIQDGQTSLTTIPSPSLIDRETARIFDGHRGDLVAVVKETRESTHIGDLFRGVSPRTPEIGQIIVLGSGALFSEPAPEGGLMVGLRPNDGRSTDWLNIRALYDAHEQSVELNFHPTR